MKPAVSPASEATPSSRPGRSGRRSGLSGDSVTCRRSKNPVSAQIGTLTRKIDRQPATATSAPPITGPSATPSEPMPPHTPSAPARARGSGNWCPSRAHGSRADAPRPCTARAAIRTPSDGAAAQAHLIRVPHGPRPHASASPGDVQSRTERSTADVQAALRDIAGARPVDQAEEPEVSAEVVIQGCGPRDLALAAGFEPDVRRAGELRAPQRGDRAYLARGGERLAAV